MVGTTTRLDRMGPKRSDTAWIEQHLADPQSRFLVLADLKPVIRSNAERSEVSLAWFSREQLTGLGLASGDALFLGIDEAGTAHFALPISEHRATHAPGGLELLRPSVDLRTLAMQGVMPADDVALAGQARGLAAWHENSHHCGHCGGTTLIKDGGWRRKCWACGREAFPRTDPVVIMLISDGENCLLAHEHRYAANMYSALAGFIEAGEDIEHAVRREVFEETAVRVGDVRYFASQSWPLPHSLMLGCLGRAQTRDITIDRNEIADARWFSREEAAQMLTGTHPGGLTCPGKHAIANKLITAFVKGEGGV